MCPLSFVTLRGMTNVVIHDELMRWMGVCCILTFESSGHVSCKGEKVCRLKVLSNLLFMCPNGISCFAMGTYCSFWAINMCEELVFPLLDLLFLFELLFTLLQFLSFPATNSFAFVSLFLCPLRLLQ